MSEPVYYDKDGRPYTVRDGVSVWLPAPPPNGPPNEQTSGAPRTPVTVSSPKLSKEAERHNRMRTIALWGGGLVGVWMLFSLVNETNVSSNSATHETAASPSPNPNAARETAASAPVLPTQPPDTVRNPLLGITKSIREVEGAMYIYQRSGLITSIDKVNNEIQVNRMLWETLSLDAKKGAVLTCALYFQAQGERERGHGSAYTVLVDNRTGRKLAENDGWSGIQVFGD